MEDAHALLTGLAMVLCVAAVTTVLFQRLHQPVVLGYIVAGLIIGPNVSIPLVADPEVIRTLSELGVILLMFFLGLEFSLRKLFHVGATAGVTAIIQTSLMVWLGFVIARAFGWTTYESIFTGAAIAISSTTIIAKAFDEQRIRGRLRELVVGILIVEDLIAILMMAALTAAASGQGLSAGALAWTVARLLAFLFGLVGVGMLVVPRAIRGIVRWARPETTLVASVGLCFAFALIALELGYSVALGAFIAGSLVAESGEEKTVEHLIEPVRDMFAAIFFVSVGMMIQPAILLEHWGAVTAMTLAVIFGKIFGVSFGSFLTGSDIRLSLKTGMSLAQIGEFSFIIAGLGLTLGVIGERVYTIAVAVSAITTLTTPWLIASSDRAAGWIERKLPGAVQTYAALYASWIERIRNSPPRRTRGATMRRLAGLLFLDASLLAALLVGGAILMERARVSLTGGYGFTDEIAEVALLAGLVVISVPFWLGIFSIAGRLGILLAEMAHPAAQTGELDLSAAPRKALAATLHVALVLVAGVPLVALTEPFLSGVPAGAMLSVLLAFLAVSLWRSAADLRGHVRAGAQMIVELLAAQSRAAAPAGAGAHGSASEPERHSLAPVSEMLHGLGDPVAISVPADSPAVGRTLAEINLWGATGATVLAITRGGKGLLVPSPRESIHASDVLAVAGTAESVAAARVLLTGRTAPPTGASQGQAA